MNWFYEFNGEQKGPVSESELDRLIAQGVVLPTTLVWRDGLSNWTPLAQARPLSPPPLAPAGSGAVQCESCGRLFSGTDVIQIAGRNICASCKPAVLQSLQQGGSYAEVGELGRTGPAWEARETLGFFKAARDTVTAVLFRPSEAFSTMRVTGGLTNPFWYALIFAGLGQAVFSVLFTLLQGSILSSNPVFQKQPNPFGSPVPMAIFQFFWAFFAVAIGVFMQSGIVHLCLMVCGGARRPYEATFRAICYGTGSVALLNLIPIVGTIAWIPWSLIVTCIGLAKTHETELWRSVLAVFLPMIVCCFVILAFAIVIAGVAGAQHH